MVPPRYGHQRQTGRLDHRDDGNSGLAMVALVGGGKETDIIKEQQQGAAETGGCAVGTVWVTGSLATAYGVWEKDGEYYVYSPFRGVGLLAQSMLRRR